MPLKLTICPASLFLSCLLNACAAQPHQPAAPETAPLPVKAKTPAPTASAAPAESAPVATAEAPAPAAAPEPEPAQVPATAPRIFPVDVLTGPQTAFLIDYNNSPAKEHAQKHCSQTEKSEDADAERAKIDACLAKERSKFTADVLRFRKNEKGNGGTLTIYRRNGSALPEVYLAKVEYKEAGNNAVKVIIKGGLSGARPICRDHQDLDVKVPNDYSIELEDSVFGKLTYDAKIGLVGN